MKKDDYINSVMSAFKGRNKSMIKDELNAHLEDWIDRYAEMGYIAEQAEEKAVERMGDAELVGARLTKIHSKKATKDVCWLLFFAYVGWTLLLYLTIFAWGSEVNLFTMGIEFSFLLLSVISLLAANRMKSEAAAVISLLFTAIFFAGKAVLSGFHSILLYGVYFVLSGNIDDFIIISQLGNSVNSNILLGFSFVFYFLWVISYIFTFANIAKFNALKYSKKDIKREKIFKRSIVAVLIFFTVIMALLFAFKLSDGYGDHIDGTSHSYFDGVCIIESDEICDIENYYYNSEAVPALLYGYYSFNTVGTDAEDSKLFSANCIDTEKKYNDAVTYRFYTHSARYAATKKYIAAIPVCCDGDSDSNDFRDYSTPCFDNVQWYPANETKKLTGCLHRETDAAKTDGYSIEICNIPAMDDDELVHYAVDVLEELIFCYYGIEDSDLEAFTGATNSTFTGDIGSGTYIYHFIMDGRIDVHISIDSRTAVFYKNDKLIYEQDFPWEYE
ncbi:MAG: permease prefix domain 1-containing protein [Clostridium sp.]|nr:permease prefix domain 1-containing protein [Clostridium sp.]